MTIALLVGPSHEPVTLDEAKRHLRIDHDEEDTLIQELISAARLHTEFATGQKLLTQSWRQYETGREMRVQALVAPAQSVEAVTAFDDEGTPRILAVQDWFFHRREHDPLLEISVSIPRQHFANGLEIDWVVGLADMAVDLPSSLKRAVLLLVAHWYEFRGAVEVGQQPVSLPIGFDALVRPFQRMRLS